MKITERQTEMMIFIENFIEDHGWPPTIAEIMENFGWKSPISVTQKLKSLQTKGYLRLHPRVARGIEILQSVQNRGKSRSIPIVGTVAAGLPSEAPENIEDWIDPNDLAQFFGRSKLRHEGLFILRVRGESMIDAGILEGDYLLIRPVERADEGEIVVALVDGETTVKRLMYNGAEILLQPMHPYMEDIVIGPERTIEIQGLLVGVVRRVN